MTSELFRVLALRDKQNEREREESRREKIMRQERQNGSEETEIKRQDSVKERLKEMKGGEREKKREMKSDR